MFQITCKVEFDAAHRLLGYQGKCANTHGHRYVVEATVACEDLDHQEMILDFHELKRIVEEASSKLMDHKMLIHPQDSFEGETYNMGSGNPTAENMACEIFNRVRRQLDQVDPDLVLVNLRLYETPDCWCDYHE